VYDAQTAESGPQALAMFSERGAEVVLTDYRMAEMNGHELLKRIRERDPNVMVILMTAYATVENAVAAMKDGAYDYLTKPFSLEMSDRLRSFEQRLQNTISKSDLTRRDDRAVQLIAPGVGR
jgi:DNA-binding NtrC family response regulator